MRRGTCSITKRTCPFKALFFDRDGVAEDTAHDNCPIDSYKPKQKESYGYNAVCVNLYNPPERDNSPKESFTLRMPDDLRAALQKRADKEGRTLSNYIIYLLGKAVKK